MHSNRGNGGESIWSWPPLILLLLPLACAHRLPPLTLPPDSAFGPIPEGAISALNTPQIDSLRAEFHVKMEMKGVKYRGRLRGILLYRRGEGLRVELYSPFLTPVCIIRIAKGTVEVLLPEKRERYTGNGLWEALPGLTLFTGDPDDAILPLAGIFSIPPGSRGLSTARRGGMTFIRLKGGVGGDGEEMSMTWGIEDDGGRVGFLYIEKGGRWVSSIRYGDHFLMQGYPFPATFEIKTICGILTISFREGSFTPNGDISPEDMELPLTGREILMPLPLLDWGCGS